MDTNMNRRRLLLGLAAASSAAAAPVAAAAVASAENPELIRLGDMLPGIAVEYAEARAQRSAVFKQWSPSWPAAPDELYCSGGDAIERDLAGWGIERPTKWGFNRSRNIWTVEDLQWHIDAAGVKRARTDKTHARAAARAEPYRELLPVAERYEAECNHIRQASGYTAAKARLAAAEGALIAVVRAIMEQQESTMAGVVVKAQAMAAASDLPAFAGLADGALAWGPELAASVLRLATESGIA